MPARWLRAGVRCTRDTSVQAAGSAAADGPRTRRTWRCFTVERVQPWRTSTLRAASFRLQHVDRGSLRRLDAMPAEHLVDDGPHRDEPHDGVALEGDRLDLVQRRRAVVEVGT